MIGMTRKQSLTWLMLGGALQFGAPALAADVNADVMPPTTKDYAAARDIIASPIDHHIPELRTPARPQEMLQGVVTAMDERNDRIAVRLTSDIVATFKVQDGLVFDAVRRGDQVELTLETIDGAKTIVGLRKE
jgi:hypothetical protein